MKAKYIILSLLGAAALLFGCAKEPITGRDNSVLKVDNSYVRIDTLGGTATIKLDAKESWKLLVKTSYEYEYIPEGDTTGKKKKATVDTLVTPGTHSKPRGIKNPITSWIAVDNIQIQKVSWKEAPADSLIVGEAGTTDIVFSAPAGTSYRTQDVRIISESGAQIILRVAQGEDVIKTYTVKEVVSLIKSGKAGGSPVLVKGIICKIDEISTSYGNATYYLSDDGTMTGSYDENGGDGNWFEVYRGYWLGGEKFTKGDEIAVGDEVTVKGTLTLYKGIPETNQNDSEITEIKKSLVAVSPSSFSVSKRDTTLKVGALYSGYNLNYAIDSLGKTFLSIVGTEQVGDTTFVEIHVAPNTNPVERTGVVTLISAKDKASSRATVTVSQEGDAVIATITEALALASGTAVLVEDALVSAKTTAGFVATDGDSAVYVYDLGANPDVKVGDKVQFAGITGAYNGVPQIATITNFKVKSSDNAVSYPVATILNDVGFADYTSSSAAFVCFYGTLKLTMDGDNVKYANIEVDGADATKIQGSLTKPTADLGLAALANKVVTVKGYYTGKSGSKDPRYHNVIVTSIEEGISVPVALKFKKVTAITSGKTYVMAYTDAETTYMATVITDATKSYGYYYTKTVEVESDIITLADENDALVFTQNGTGWYIQQKYDDRYAYCDGSHGSVQLNAEAPTNLWNINMDAGNATISFTNSDATPVTYYFSHTLYNTTHEFCPVKNTAGAVNLYEKQ